MSISELKNFLDRRGIDHSYCIEKADLIELALGCLPSSSTRNVSPRRSADNTTTNTTTNGPPSEPPRASFDPYSNTRNGPSNNGYNGPPP